MIERIRAQASLARSPGLDVAALQRALDSSCQELLAQGEDGPMRRYSMVAARGPPRAAG